MTKLVPVVRRIEKKELVVKVNRPEDDTIQITIKTDKLKKLRHFDPLMYFKSRK